MHLTQVLCCFASTMLLGFRCRSSFLHFTWIPSAVPRPWLWLGSPRTHYLHKYLLFLDICVFLVLRVGINSCAVKPPDNIVCRHQHAMSLELWAS